MAEPEISEPTSSIKSSLPKKLWTSCSSEKMCEEEHACGTQRYVISETRAKHVKNESIYDHEIWNQALTFWVLMLLVEAWNSFMLWRGSKDKGIVPSVSCWSMMLEVDIEPKLHPLIEARLICLGLGSLFVWPPNVVLSLWEASSSSQPLVVRRTHPSSEWRRHGCWRDRTADVAGATFMSSLELPNILENLRRNPREGGVLVVVALPRLRRLPLSIVDKDEE